MLEEAKWGNSQKAEIDFWKQGEQKYAHFSRQYWEHELENYCGYIQPNCTFQKIEEMLIHIPNKYQSKDSIDFDLLHESFPCRPCEYGHCKNIGHSCMDAIPAELVIQKINELSIRKPSKYRLGN